MPQSQANPILQDRRGFLWIGTRNGLSRFDGVEFRNYFRKDGLPSNIIQELVADMNGDIWALFSQGLAKYNGVNFDFFPPPPEFEQWLFSTVCNADSANCFFLLNMHVERKENTLYFFDNGRYSDYSGKIPALDTINFSWIFFEQDTRNLLLLDAKRRLWSWNGDNLGKITDIEFELGWHEDDVPYFLDGDMKYRYSGGKLVLIDQESIAPNSRYGIYISNEKAAAKINDSGIKIPFARNTPGFLDQEGILWFGTEKNLFRLISTAFITISPEDGLTNTCWAIAEDNSGHLWFGSLFGDLQEYDGKVFRLRNEYKSLFRNKVSFYKGSRRMSNGDVWFSTNQGVLIWDGTKFSKFYGIPELTQVCTIYEDPDDGSVIVGTNLGLYFLSDGNLKIFPEFRGIGLGVIEGVVKDDRGKYWLSGQQGLTLFDGKAFEKINDSILPPTYTYTLDKDIYGGMWITSEEGLFCYSGLTARFMHGLPEAINKPANSLIMMDNTHLLVGRVADICIIDIKKFYEGRTDYFRIYDKTDGFMGEDCLDNGIVKDRDGIYWILTSDNVIKFDAGALVENQVPPRLHITGFEYLDKDLKWLSAYDTGMFFGKFNEVILKRFQNTVRIHYAGISTPNPEKVVYQHLLKGFEEKWSLEGKDRFIEYERLNPGTYSFHLLSANADGVQSSDPLVFKFRIVPAFWQRVIFKIIMVFSGIIMIVFGTMHFVKKSQRKRFEREQLESELTSLQMTSTVRQFDPHFTFNVLSSVGSLIMKGEREFAYDYILKLSNLLRSLLSDGSISLKTLSDELDFVERYLELQKLRFRNRLNYHINLNENVNIRQELPKMTIQTFVENAIKHGIENKPGGGTVEIIITTRDKWIEITVKDDGIGREAARKLKSGGTGHGLNFIEGLFSMMNRHNRNKAEVIIVDLYDSDKLPSGTEVKIIIPVDYKFRNKLTG